MKVSVNWLKELVDINLSIEELAHTLTMAGLEVEEIAPVAQFDSVVVAEVKSTVPHPNADKLKVCQVDAGTGSLLQIVCGAPNVAPGMRVPCALVGAKLPAIEIRAAKIRGVESCGMLCSARELGLSDDHAGLLALAADAPIGQDVRKYLEMDDVYLTLKMTPNRGDCLSMVGIARDLAAVTGAKLAVPSIEKASSNSTESRSISISAPRACGLYLGRVISNIDNKAATPDWMKKRLERAGFRSIAPLVDITNYLTLERGRPMHAFDQAKLRGGINVRFAQAGEEMSLLNEQHVSLQPDMLLITDESGAVAMGGVMGGLESMCTPDTTGVFLESAYFDPAVIQGKTRTLGINSDAAFRFERGVDPNGAWDGIEYATRLVLEICGTPTTTIGHVTQGTGELPVRPPVRVRPARVQRLLGMPLPTAEMVSYLQRLNCTVALSVDASELQVTPPSYRFDLCIEEDFVEEIARIHGYEKVPALPPVSSLPISAVPEANKSRHAIRHTLAGMGYQEVINYSFVPEKWEADFSANTSPLKLANPISIEMSVMRTSLIGGLVSTLQHNLNHGESRIKVFEVGRCFLRDEVSLPAQPERLAGLMSGSRFPEQWGEGGQKGSAGDFFAIKGEIEILLTGLNPRFEKALHPALHPGRSAQISVDGQAVGHIGELHPGLSQEYDLTVSAIVFELDIRVFEKLCAPVFSDFSRMQSVRRDVALLVDDAIEIQSIVDEVTRLKIPNLVEFALFDVYRGQNLDAGRKSVAFRVVMQDTDRTLTDSEADSKVSEIVEVLSQKYGATLRK